MKSEFEQFISRVQNISFQLDINNFPKKEDTKVYKFNQYINWKISYEGSYSFQRLSKKQTHEKIFNNFKTNSLSGGIKKNLFLSKIRIFSRSVWLDTIKLNFPFFPLSFFFRTHPRTYFKCFFFFRFRIHSVEVIRFLNTKRFQIFYLRKF